MGDSGSYFGVFLLIVICPIVLIVTGVVVAKPGLIALQFLDTRCESLSFLQSGSESCSCGWRCHSVYPCFLVNVSYSVTLNNDTFSVESTIRQTDSTSADDITCSLVPSCYRNPDDNEVEVKRLLDLYGRPGRNYTCYYNPEAFTEIIIDRRFSRGAIIAALVVPGIFVFIELVIFCIIGFYCCRKHYKCNCAS